MSTINAGSFDAELPFEVAFRELESIVTKLESGELTLEQSVLLFDRGRKLAAYCQGLLDQAELRVNQIADDGTISPLEG